MKPTRFILAALAFLPALLSSQSIPIKTIPLATGDQFLLFPSRNQGAGGVSIALDDPLGDPFANPAKGSGFEGLRFFSTPTYYSVFFRNLTNEGSIGRTLPVGLSFGGKEYFGSVLWARQGLRSNTRRSPVLMAQSIFAPAFSSEDEAENSNNYSMVLFGKRFPGLKASLGASVLWGDLNAMEGVQYLYPSANRLIQKGSIAEVRLGFAGQWEEERFYEAVVSYQKTDMKHEVMTGWPIVVPWDDRFRPSRIWPSTEVHRDVTSGFGAKLGYRQPLAGSWRIGGLLAANWKSHPKIPNYELMNIPRDPGFSSAYQFGIGLTSTGKRALLGIDVIYEPITSETWAEAAAPVPAPSGRIIPIGGRTIENFFDFYNQIIRAGVRSFGERTDIQFGIQVHSIKYYLRQINHSLELRRNQKEEWNEWTISVGIGFPLFGTNVRYTGLLTTGTGQPGVSGGTWVTTGVMDYLSRSDFLVAPSGRLALNEAWVLTHQVSVLVAIE